MGCAEKMKHLDLWNVATKCINEQYLLGLEKRVLAWSANHEHAVFDLQDEVHPAAVCVWFQYCSEGRSTILKVVNHSGDWGLSELGAGKIPFVSNNPFVPDGRDAASNADGGVCFSTEPIGGGRASTTQA